MHKYSLLLVAVALCACGDGSGPALDEVGDEFAAASCDHLDTCLGQYADLFVGPDCVDTLTLQIEDGALPAWEEAIAAGTLEYDSGAARDCISDVRSEACDAVNPRHRACENVFQGNVALGDGCQLNEECQGDAYCLVGASCPGTCTGLGGAGSSCDQDEACQAGLECSGGQCGSKTAIGGSCAEDDDCAGFSSCQDARCVAIIDLGTATMGEPCDPETGTLCRDGLSCVLDDFDLETETAIWTCVGSSSSGGTCKAGFPDPCPTDEACDADPEMTLVFEGMCQPLPSAGQACRTGDLGNACAPTLVCSDGTCRGLQRLGATCASDRECYSDNCSSELCAPVMCEP